MGGDDGRISENDGSGWRNSGETPLSDMLQSVHDPMRHERPRRGLRVHNEHHDVVAFQSLNDSSRLRQSKLVYACTLSGLKMQSALTVRIRALVRLVVGRQERNGWPFREIFQRTQRGHRGKLQSLSQNST